MERVANGLIAGAAGTAALNTVTYLDMLIRGRPASSVPAKVAERMADAAGAELGESEEQADSRRSAAGALLGYGAGLTIGAAYGAIEGAVRDLPLPISGAAVGLVAMAASDVPAVAAGATDPRRWQASAWLADIVPHAVYGIVTVAVYRALRR